MAAIPSYPQATPGPEDLLLGINVTLDAGADSPKTRTFTVGSIVELASNGVAGPPGPTGAQGAEGIQGPRGLDGAVGPAGLNWRGTWAPITSYIEDDAVGWNGASWFCILAIAGSEYPNLDTTHWALLASQGAQGFTGPQGPTGAQGIPGVSGTQTLAETLVLGNNTGGTNILLNDADSLYLENGSYLIKGTYDFGAAGGISKICGVGYEDMWQAGFRHVFDANGFIRNSTNCFNLVPSIGSDVTRRYKVGSIWTLDNLTNYICTDATEGAAVWQLYKEIPTIGTVSATETGVVNNTSLQELGGVDKTINGVRIGVGNLLDPLAENTAVGYKALQLVVHNTGYEGYYNSAFGHEALKSLTTGYQNDAFGDFVLNACTTGTFNTGFGAGALSSLTIGLGNTGIGSGALTYNISGQRNTAVGGAALAKNTGSNNTAVGYLANGSSTSSGNWNIAIGMQAGRDITTGSNNLLIENITNASITSGSYNIVLNPKQKSGVTTGSYNTIIGAFDGTFPSAMSNNVILADGQGNIRFRTTDTGLTTVPGQTNALIDGDATGKTVVTKEYISGVVKPYKVYTALLTRTGATEPTATILENTLGALTFSYVTTGIYSINSSSLFTLGKTVVFIQQQASGSFGNVLGASRITVNSIQIFQSTSSGTNDSNWGFPVSIEIRVYN
jgi:hypothetical protein